MEFNREHYIRITNGQLSFPCHGVLHEYTHYSDVIISTMAYQITSLTIVYSTVYSGTDQRKHQSSASLAFVRGIHRWAVTGDRHKRPVTRKKLPFHDVILHQTLHWYHPHRRAMGCFVVHGQYSGKKPALYRDSNLSHTYKNVCKNRVCYILYVWHVCAYLIFHMIFITNEPHETNITNTGTPFSAVRPALQRRHKCMRLLKSSTYRLFTQQLV